MIINKIELNDLDLYDADVVESYENILAEVEKKYNEIPSGIKASASIKKQCNIIFDCFNNLFGDGTDVKVFGGKTNLLVCLKAFEELIIQNNEQKGELEKMLSKHSPNRTTKKR